MKAIKENISFSISIATIIISVALSVGNLYLDFHDLQRDNEANKETIKAQAARIIELEQFKIEQDKRNLTQKYINKNIKKELLKVK